MQFMMDRFENDAKNAPDYEKRRKALFNARSKANGWDTEYRRSYVGYDGEEYQKVWSARPFPLKNASAFFIPA